MASSSASMMLLPIGTTKYLPDPVPDIRSRNFSVSVDESTRSRLNAIACVKISTLAVLLGVLAMASMAWSNGASNTSSLMLATRAAVQGVRPNPTKPVALTPNHARLVPNQARPVPVVKPRTPEMTRVESTKAIHNPGPYDWGGHPMGSDDWEPDPEVETFREDDDPLEGLEKLQFVRNQAQAGYQTLAAAGLAIIASITAFFLKQQERAMAVGTGIRNFFSGWWNGINTRYERFVEWQVDVILGVRDFCVWFGTGIRTCIKEAPKNLGTWSPLTTEAPMIVYHPLVRRQVLTGGLKGDLTALNNKELSASPSDPNGLPPKASELLIKVREEMDYAMQPFNLDLLDSDSLPKKSEIEASREAMEMELMEVHAQDQLHQVMDFYRTSNIDDALVLAQNSGSLDYAEEDIQTVVAFYKRRMQEDREIALKNFETEWRAVEQSAIETENKAINAMQEEAMSRGLSESPKVVASSQTMSATKAEDEVWEKGMEQDKLKKPAMMSVQKVVEGGDGNPEQLTQDQIWKAAMDTKDRNSSANPVVESVAEEVGEFVGKVAGKAVGGSVGAMGGSVTGIGQSLKAVGGTIDRIAEALDSTDPSDPKHDTKEKMSDMIDAVGDALGAVGDGVEHVGQAVGVVGDAVEDVVEAAVDDLVDGALEGSLDSDEVEEEMEAGKKAVSDAAAKAMNSLKEAKEKIQEAAEEVEEESEEAAIKAEEIAKALEHSKSAHPIVESVAEEVGMVMGKAAGKAVGGSVGAMGKSVNKIGQGLKAVGGSMERIGEALESADASDPKHDTKEKVGEMIEAVGDALEAVGDGIEDVGQAVGVAGKSVEDVLEAAVDDLVEGAIEGSIDAKELKEELKAGKAAVSNAVTKAMGGLNKATEKIKEAAEVVEEEVEEFKEATKSTEDDDEKDEEADDEPKLAPIQAAASESEPAPEAEPAAEPEAEAATEPEPAAEPKPMSKVAERIARAKAQSIKVPNEPIIPSRAAIQESFYEGDEGDSKPKKASKKPEPTEEAGTLQRMDKFLEDNYAKVDPGLVKVSTNVSKTVGDVAAEVAAETLKNPTVREGAKTAANIAKNVAKTAVPLGMKAGLWAMNAGGKALKELDKASKERRESKKKDGE